MSFERPEVLWFLLVVPVLLAVFLATYRRGREELLRLGGEWKKSQLLPVYLLKSFFSGLFFLLAMTALILAWSGPSWGLRSVAEHQDGLDVALVFDVSWSMTAKDALPNRLAQSQEAARVLIQSFPHTRFSLVAFKGRAKTLVPLTTDTTVLNDWIDAVGPSSTSGPGSDIEAGLREALRSLTVPTDHHKVVILLSDGEARGGDAIAGARSLAAHGVEVFTFGLGTTQGAVIPEGAGSLVDDWGFTVKTRLHKNLLRVIATETGGQAYLGISRENLNDLQQRLAGLSNPSAHGGVRLDPVAQFRFALLVVLGTLVGYLLIWIVPWRKTF